MTIEHACFISFPRGVGNDTLFANEFYEEFVRHLAMFDKRLSVFKFDRCEARRRGDDWTLWVQRELCSSAMMMAVCAPNYFVGSPACVSEFRGMEALIRERGRVLGSAAQGAPPRDWLIALRLKDSVPMPELDPHQHAVSDFLECAISPKKVRQTHRCRERVSVLAKRVYDHWCWLQDGGRAAQLQAAGICSGFKLPAEPAVIAPPFPFAGGVR